MSTPAHRPRKRFGQHFLIQPSIARRIVETARLSREESVLEIGPGRGALTGMLAERAARLWLIEVDRDLAAGLREQFAGRSHVQVIEADVLDLDLGKLLAARAPVVIVANLPYNISTAVLMKLLERPELVDRAVLMLQKEVAERLCAGPDEDPYGALSVMVQVVASVRIAFRVPAAAFFPKPKVDSAVVVIQPHETRLDPARLAAIRRLVRATFGQRRKQLANTLASLTPHPRPLLDSLGIDPKRRPETLTIEEFSRIAEKLDRN